MGSFFSDYSGFWIPCVFAIAAFEFALRHARSKGRSGAHWLIWFFISLLSIGAVVTAIAFIGLASTDNCEGCISGTEVGLFLLIGSLWFAQALRSAFVISRSARLVPEAVSGN